MDDHHQPTLDLEGLPESLTAYLDGELTPAESAQVEERMAQDETFRRQVQQAQQAWDLLDCLPREEVNETFTRTTVEMAALAASQELAGAQTSGPRRWLEGGLMLGGLLVSVALGYFVVAGLLIWPAADQAGTAPPASLDADQQEFIRWFGSLTPQERQHLVQLTAADQRREFESRRKRDEFFQWAERLSEEDQSQLLALLTDQSVDQLNESRAEREYQEWTNSLTPERRQQLAALPSEQRQQQFQQVKHAWQLQRFERLTNAKVSPEDLRAIFAWLDNYARDHQEEIIAELPEQYRNHLREVKDMTLRQRLSMLALLRDRQRLPEPDETELARLQASLTPAAQRLLDLVPEGQSRMGLVMRWMQAAVVARMSRGAAGNRGPGLNKEELLRFSESLAPAEKERMKKLQPADREWELRRQYMEWRRSQREESPHEGRPPQRPFPRFAPGDRPGARRD